jgi:hypothetical protein
MRISNIKWGVAALAAAATLAVPQARADFIFNLNGSNLGSGYTGPFAQVDVNLASSTTATITFTSQTVGGNIYLLLDGGSVGVNVNATSWTLSNITGSNAGTGFTPGPYSDGGAGNEDGYGVFNQKIDSFDSFTHSADKISFKLTDTSGTWATATDVLKGNSIGNIAAAHIGVTASPANASGSAIVTGFAAGNGTSGTPVPEPTTMIAGALLLLPFGASTLRVLRRNRTA